nr:MAG TPA: hypothetical protein [Caudoviricetes sp.]
MIAVQLTQLIKAPFARELLGYLSNFLLVSLHSHQ